MLRPYLIQSKLDLYRVVAYAIFAGSIVSVLTFQRARYGRRNDPRAIRIGFGSGIYPACAYDLRPLVPGPDHSITCPECGGGWTKD